MAAGVLAVAFGDDFFEPSSTLKVENVGLTLISGFGFFAVAAFCSAVDDPDAAFEGWAAAVVPALAVAEAAAVVVAWLRLDIEYLLCT